MKHRHIHGQTHGTPHLQGLDIILKYHKGGYIVLHGYMSIYLKLALYFFFLNCGILLGDEDEDDDEDVDDDEDDDDN